jgi:hypothetical protein
MRPGSLILFTALASLGALAACAEGSNVDLGSGAASSGGAGGAGGSRITVGSSSSGMGATSSASGSGSGGSSSSSGSGGSSSSSGSGGSPCSFQAPNTCSTADILNGVSGDTGGITTTSGVGSKWFKIHVTEDDSSVFETDPATR